MASKCNSFLEQFLIHSLLVPSTSVFTVFCFYQVIILLKCCRILSKQSLSIYPGPSLVPCTVPTQPPQQGSPAKGTCRHVGWSGTQAAETCGAGGLAHPSLVLPACRLEQWECRARRVGRPDWGEPEELTEPSGPY